MVRRRFTWKPNGRASWEQLTDMTTPDSDRLSQLRAEAAAIEGAMREAAQEAVLAHQRLGLPMVTWQDGKVVWIPADQLASNEARVTQ